MDPVEAEQVRLIFKLYADGVDASRPLGVKETTKWLNEHGYRICADCGSAMTRTGTVRRHRCYSYYSCSGYHRKGKAVCKRRHIPAQKLDDLVVTNVKEQLLTPERLMAILKELTARETRKDRGVAERRAALALEIEANSQKLDRLYRAIENGIAALDAQLKEPIQALKTERDIAQASLARIEARASLPTPEPNKPRKYSVAENRRSRLF